MSKKYTKEFIKKCYKEYSEGISLTKIARKYNVDRATLSSSIKKEFNIDSFKTKNNSIYNLNENYFNDIDNEEQAYWLGFLYADGYLKKDKPVIELSLKGSDAGHLDKFKHSIGSNHKTYMRKVKLKDKEHDSCRVCLYNKTMHSDLIKLGCVNSKSKIIEYPNFINEELERHFIRGFFDGDGNISLETNSTDKISRVRFFSGSESFIKELCNRLNYLLGININYKWDRTCFALIYTRKNEKLKVLNYMYKDCSVYLDRKFNLYKKYACRFES